MKKRIIALLVGIAALNANALATPALMPHSAEYKVKIKVVSGHLSTTLVASDAGYTAIHIIKPTGMSKLITRGKMDVTSNFAVAADGVKPISYHSNDTIRDDPAVDITFDWERDQAFGRVGEDAVSIPLPGLAHDNVSIQYQLMHDLLADSETAQYTLFDVDKLKTTTVTRIGTKTVKTKAGRFDAVGVRHQNEGSSRITTLWCVEELGFLPVVIEQHRKGKLNFRASLLKYTPTALDVQD